jgi:hypothetical protein
MVSTDIFVLPLNRAFLRPHNSHASPQESQHQSIGDTIVQLFISEASVLMTRVDRIQSEPVQPEIGE